MRNQVPSDPIVTIDQLVLKQLFVFFERGGDWGCQKGTFIALSLLEWLILKQFLLENVYYLNNKRKNIEGL